MSSRARRPPASRKSLTFFVDRSLGSKIVPTALKSAGKNVEIHDDHFAPETPDVEWIRAVADRKWIVLTCDERIGRNPLERETLLYSGARAFVLTTAEAAGPEQAEIFVRHLPTIERLAVRKSGGAFIAKVGRLGVRIWKRGLGRVMRKKM